MRVLARAYGDAALEREVSGAFDGGYFLVNPSVEHAMSDDMAGVGFPRAYVFKFDADLYQRINEALGRGDTNEVQALWGRATPVS